MAFINKIEICNFKAFYGKHTIKFEGKHLLLYGENGSGKSSIYWALYTVFQSILKEPKEIKKYFDPGQDENLINKFHIQAKAEELNIEGTPNINYIESYIKLYFTNGNIIKVSSEGCQVEKENEGIPLLHLEKLNKYSDFIHHRILSDFYNFKNSEEINLWSLFLRHIFPYLAMDKGSSDHSLRQGVTKIIESDAPYSISKDSPKFKLKTHPPQNFISKIGKFNDDVSYWLNEINSKVSNFYNDNLAFKDDPELRITLNYDEKLRFKTKFQQEFLGKTREYKKGGFNTPKIGLKIELRTDKGFVPISRPQTFINEARLTGIALSIRFVLLLNFVRPDKEEKVLLLDDLLISLDMSNRSKVLDVILNKFSSQYKILLFTHSLEFFRFCDYKIGQNNTKRDWNIKEIHFDDEELKPLIVDSQLDYLTKAKKYYHAKDYIASSVFLRKEIERFIKERIPEEFIKGEKFHSLNHLWKLLVKRYEKLGYTIDKEIHNGFEQSKLMVLNPSAHDNLSQRIYKIELENAFSFREELENIFPLYNRIMVLKEGTVLEFRHPTEDYVFEFSFKSDLFKEQTEAKIAPNNPKCTIKHWSFKGQKFYDFKEEEIISKKSQVKIKEKPIKFFKMIEKLSKEESLQIDYEMFKINTFLKDSKLSLGTILEGFDLEDKAKGIVI